MKKEYTAAKTASGMWAVVNPSGLVLRAGLTQEQATLSARRLTRSRVGDGPLHVEAERHLADARRFAFSAATLIQNGPASADDLGLVVEDLRRALEAARRAADVQAQFEDEQQ